MQKHLLSLLVLLLAGTTASLNAQVLNWQNLSREQRHLVHVNAGMEYALVYGAGYSFHPATRRQLLLGLDISLPVGKQVFDDLKVRTGLQLELYKLNNLHLSGQIKAIYRRYENPIVQLDNFGSETGLTLGYYRRRWFVAADGNFDKAIVTHFKHSAAAREDFPGITNGWFVPTAGNLQYGIQAGFSLKQADITLKAGKIVSQDFKHAPMVPYYAQLGCSWKIGG